MSTLKSAGDKITLDIFREVFVKGAYGLGAVYEPRGIKTGITSIYPGLAIQHDTGAGGEDEYIIGADKGSLWYGIAELDPGVVASQAVAYEALDEIKGIAFHLNPGAYLQGVQYVDPSTTADPEVGLVSGSGTAGTFMAIIEFTMANSSAAGKGCFSSTTWGTNNAAGTQHYSRIYMRNAYYLADPTATVRIVAYIAGTGA